MHKNSSVFLRGTTNVLFAEALLIPTGFITAVFLARELQPVGYGIFALVTQLVIWTEYLLVSGLENTTITFIAGSFEKKPLINTVYVIYTIFGILTALAIILLAPAISLLIKAPDTVPLLRLLSIDVPIFALAHAGRHVAAGSQQFRRNAAMRSIYWVSRLIFIICFVSIGMSVRGAILGLICASTAEAVLGFILVKPDFLHGGYASISRFRRVMAPLQLAELNKRVLVQELIILKALGGSSAAVGTYGAAKNLALAPLLLSRALKPTLLSILNKTRHDDEDGAARALAVTTLRSLFWLLPSAAIGAVCAEEIIDFIFGPAYTPAAALFSFLLFAGMGFLAINIGIVLFTVWNYPKISVQVTWPMLPVAAVGYIIGYPAYGATGIAAATLAAVLTGTILTFFMLHRHLHIDLPVLTVIRSIGCSLAVAAAAFLWPVSGAAVIAKVLLGMGMSVLLLRITGELSQYDRVFLRSIWKKPGPEIPDER